MGGKEINVFTLLGACFLFYLRYRKVKKVVTPYKCRARTLILVFIWKQFKLEKLALFLNSTNVLVWSDGVNNDRHEAVINTTKLTTLSVEGSSAI